MNAMDEDKIKEGFEILIKTLILKGELRGDVRCDLCARDYTESDACGGFVLGSTAVCPECAPDFRKNIERNGEQSYISGECPEGMSFREWVLSIR